MRLRSSRSVWPAAALLGALFVAGGCGESGSSEAGLHDPSAPSAPGSPSPGEERSTAEGSTTPTPAPDPGPAAETASPADAGGPLPYAHADLWKPDMSGTAGLDPYLAPLVYLARDVEDAAVVPVLAARTPGGAAAFELARPTVYYDDGSVTLDGRTHRQLTFVWYAAHEPEAAPVPQGLRTTFASDGHPWLHEVLRSPAGERHLYATAEAEAAAQAAHGAALPGVAHALEREPMPGMPTVRLVDVLVDGPVPMGPYAYVTPDANRLDALHCRCEPTRADELVDMHTYALAPLASLLESLPEDERAALDFGPPDWVALVLRLPDAF